MIYTEQDYLIAKLRGEIEPTYEYRELQFIGHPPKKYKVREHPPETCEQWLDRMNNRIIRP